MITLNEPISTDAAFGSLIELQQENLKLLEEKAGPSAAAEGGAAAQSNEIMQFIGRAVATGAILQRSSERRAAQAAIDYWTTSLILSGEYWGEPSTEKGTGAEGPQAPAPVLAEFDRTKASASVGIDSGISPYKGLDPFAEGDAINFFGREDAVEELQKRIEGEHSVVVLLGPSGTGKSSLINAGLLPRLKEKDHKVVVVGAFGREPLAAILHAIKPGADIATIRSDERNIVRTPKNLNDVLSSVYPKAVLVLDQFGEVMTRTDVYPSLDIVGQALDSLRGTHRLLICIRENQRLQFANIAGIGAVVRSPANCFSPPPPSVYELRSMIEGPAERVGLRFGDGVVEDLVRSVAGNPDALPLLQFTLNKLWDNREHNEITQEVYRKVGSPREALTSTADSVLRQCSAADRDLARRIFLKLVMPAGEKDFVRNRVGRDVLSMGEDGQAVDRILAAFEQAKLLRRIPAPEIGGEDRFVVAHETLIAYWPTLASWLADARQERETEAKLISTARLWLDSGRADGYLITGEALEKFRDYRSDSLDVRQLLEASFKAEADRQAAAVRRRKRYQGIAIVTIAFLAFVAGWVVWAWSNARKEAQLEGEYMARMDNLAKLDTIKQAVASGDQKLLRESLRALNLPDESVDRITTSPPATQPDAAIQTVAPAPAPPPIPAPSPTPVVEKPPPPPQPQFDPKTGECFGFMWAGSKTNWKLKSPDSPDKLKPGPAVPNDNIYLRADFPTNPPEYAMAVPFGYVPSGSNVNVLQIRTFQRDSSLQYWTKVAAPRKSCAKVSIQYAGSDDLANQLRKSLAEADFQLAYAPEKVDRAAGLSEVRYFFKEDTALAEALADKVKDVAGKPVTLRPLLNFVASKPLIGGSLEVWVDLGGTPAPTPTK